METLKNIIALNFTTEYFEIICADEEICEQIVHRSFYSDHQPELSTDANEIGAFCSKLRNIFNSLKINVLFISISEMQHYMQSIDSLISQHPNIIALIEKHKITNINIPMRS